MIFTASRVFPSFRAHIASLRLIYTRMFVSRPVFYNHNMWHKYTCFVLCFMTTSIVNTQILSCVLQQQNYLGPVSHFITTCIQYSVSQKSISRRYSDIFSQTVGNFLTIFTHLLYVPIYVSLQIFIQLSLTMTILCHIKCDHPANFYISLEI